jgi:RNA polymerase sigma-70 factor, ECF subfamily
MPERQLQPRKSLRVVGHAEEEEFVRRCVEGDRPALRQLFEREKMRVHALLFRVVGSNLQLDDLVQDAFLEVFRSLSGFRGESSLRTWIDRCAVRVAYAHFARKSRVPMLESLPDVAGGEPDAEERASLREAGRRLYSELERLDARYRVAFVLNAVEGRPLGEVAQIMETSVVTAKVRIWRARQALERRARRDQLLAEFLSGDRKGRGGLT